MQPSGLPLYVALTADVDPDANRPRRGRPDAVSAGAAGDGVSLKACAAGLELVAETLREMRIPCTFFWEARSLRTLSEISPDTVEALISNRDYEHACHGLKHEDFSGEATGVNIGEEQALAILQQATDIIADLTGSRPKGFRAPYCRFSPALQRALTRLSYLYDASLTRKDTDESWSLLPYRLPADGPALWELALCQGRDGAGRPISGYLWQLSEGRREPRNYVDFAGRLAQRHGGGLFQIALHPWHLVVDERGGNLRERTGRDAAADMKAVLAGIMALQNVRFVSLSRYLNEVVGGRA